MPRSETPFLSLQHFVPRNSKFQAIRLLSSSRLYVLSLTQSRPCSATSCKLLQSWLVQYGLRHAIATKTTQMLQHQSRIFRCLGCWLEISCNLAEVVSELADLRGCPLKSAFTREAVLVLSCWRKLCRHGILSQDLRLCTAPGSWQSALVMESSPGPLLLVCFLPSCSYQTSPNDSHASMPCRTASSSEYSS